MKKGDEAIAFDTKVYVEHNKNAWNKIVASYG